ncbi:heme ABC exporter ATP-binding protein CcmA [Amaricoccus solimangrovi]|uniref:Heme ABC exporter ATP-binding protein CcmA n=1 Tax=Amaricoccus solimangrovi TaxID=2589815 RepID=A0A501WZG9_9RHOB|nr:heme ABC exporter ATP-binding protein CcmA [Amaricoccus solimangrovi]TPE53844.1 heme ABC exporter ATP-binding protein CcmA [Amaricoccus solimangrovi]
MGFRVTDLSCARSGRAVLRGVGFAIPEGRARLLRGPNGAGKTTLLRVLAGLLAPSAGEAELDGARLAAEPERYGENLAYCGHLDSLKPQLTVGENLRFWAALFGGGPLGPAVAAFDLEPLLDRPVHACSAGQKRRAGLARLLLAPRRLWLLDEPTVSLDTAAVARLAAAIRAHCAGGGMALVATHLPLDLGPAGEGPGAGPVELAPVEAAELATGADGDPFLTGSWA